MPLIYIIFLSGRYHICTCSCRLSKECDEFQLIQFFIRRFLICLLPGEHEFFLKYEVSHVLRSKTNKTKKKDAQQYRHTILSALVESPYLLSRFVVVTKQYIWLVLPHRACFRIAIAHAPASTSALPDNDKNDGHYNDHARPQESRHESVRSMTWLSRGTINTSFMFFLQICHWSVHQCQATSHVTVWRTCERNIGTQ